MSRKELYDDLGRRAVPSSIAEALRQIATVLLGDADDAAAQYLGDELHVSYSRVGWGATDVLDDGLKAIDAVGLSGAKCEATWDAAGELVLIISGVGRPLADLVFAHRALCDSAARGSVTYLDGTKGDYAGALAALSNGAKPEVDVTARGRKVEHYRGEIRVTETHRAKWWVTVVGGVEPVVSAVAL